jgi:hypothetical protein
MVLKQKEYFSCRLFNNAVSIYYIEYIALDDGMTDDLERTWKEGSHVTFEVLSQHLLEGLMKSWITTEHLHNISVQHYSKTNLFGEKNILCMYIIFYF